MRRLIALFPLCALACGDPSYPPTPDRRHPIALPRPNQDGDCFTDKEEQALGTDPLKTDTDGDGLTDCDEVNVHETDPAVADTDKDGRPDGEEVACVSDPKDAGETCYACGWPHDDPGTLISTGSGVGDVMKNLPFIDQCGESVHLWDFAGAYHILDMTGAWCTGCVAEAGTLASEGDAFAAETGLPFSWMLVLFQDGQGNPPNAGFPAKFAAEAGIWSLPVLGDQVSGVLSATPYDGSVFPGKCALSPAMEILHCYWGEDDEEGFEAIRQHAGVGG